MRIAARHNSLVPFHPAALQDLGPQQTSLKRRVIIRMGSESITFYAITEYEYPQNTGFRPSFVIGAERNGG
jgi:hypothetical protein